MAAPLNKGIKIMIDKLIKIQSELKAPKNQTNTFGKYKYRSCEDILEAVKPLCHENGLALTITDEIIEVGGRIYVKATATISDGNDSLSVSAWAREALEQKGMADAQLTGATSSYARKYALNGLFCIDDTKDADATNTHGKEDAPTLDFKQLLEKIQTSENVFELKARWKKYATDRTKLHAEDRKALIEEKDRIKNIFETEGGS